VSKCVRTDQSKTIPALAQKPGHSYKIVKQLLISLLTRTNVSNIGTEERELHLQTCTSAGPCSSEH